MVYDPAMGKLNACFVVGVLALAAACGDDGGAATKMDAAVDAPPDAKIFMDAPPPMFDLTCIGNTTPPTTANANITLSGTASVADGDIIGGFDVTAADATVKACDTVACNGSADGSDATDPATGAWSIGPIATGGAPLADYLEVTSTGVRTSFIYPGVPFTADQGMIPALMFGPGIVTLLDNLCDTNGPMITLAVTDCADDPVTDTANIDVIVKQGGAVVANATIIDLSTIPMAPPQVAGLFLVCDIPANNVTNIGVQYNGMNFLAHDVKAVNGTTTGTLVRPGYN